MKRCRACLEPIEISLQVQEIVLKHVDYGHAQLHNGAVYTTRHCMLEPIDRALYQICLNRLSFYPLEIERLYYEAE